MRRATESVAGEAADRGRHRDAGFSDQRATTIRRRRDSDRHEHLQSTATIAAPDGLDIGVGAERHGGNAAAATTA